jgi:hypothetical protein
MDVGHHQEVGVTKIGVSCGRTSVGDGITGQDSACMIIQKKTPLEPTDLRLPVQVAIAFGQHRCHLLFIAAISR